MNPRFCRRGIRVLSSSAQRGLSLVELLIALLLSLIVVAAIAEFFVNMSRSSQEMAKTNSQIENARFALEFLREDIMHAGFWAGFLPEYDDQSNQAVPTDLPAAVPDPCKVYTEWDEVSDADYDSYRDDMLGTPIQVHNVEPGGWSCGSLLDDKLAGTDILVVRHAATCDEDDDNCEAIAAGDLLFQVPNCLAEMSTTPYLLDPNEPVPSLTQRDCTTALPLRKYVQTMYFIRDWTNVDGDESPALVRSRLLSSGGTPAHQNPAEVLVEGIERFRVELGIDDASQSGDAVDYTAAVEWADEANRTTPCNRGDGVPDEDYVYCGAGCTAAQLADVVAARIYLLARANQPTQGYVDTKDYVMGGATVLATDLADDDFKRHVFSSTVKLNNVAGRRETPFDPNEVCP